MRRRKDLGIRVSTLVAKARETNERLRKEMERMEIEEREDGDDDDEAGSFMSCEDAPDPPHPFAAFPPVDFESAMEFALKEPVGFEPRDWRALAKAHPTRFDEMTIFREEGHKYAIRRRGGWTSVGVTSVSSILKLGYVEVTEEKLDMMAGNVWKSLKKRVESYDPSKPPAPVEEALLCTRNVRVRRVLRGETGRPELRNLLAHVLSTHDKTEEGVKAYYEELTNYFVDMGLLHHDADVGGKWGFNAELNYYIGAKHVRDFWNRNTQDGTEMHADVEAYLNGCLRDAPRDAHDFERFKKWYESPDVRERLGTIWRTELMVTYPDLLMTGSIDAVFYNERTGEYTVVDWKRTRGMETVYDKNPYYYTHDGLIVYDPKHTILAAKPFGHDKLSKYLNQLNLYRFMMMKGGYNVTRTVLVQIEPRSPHVTTYENTEFDELDVACLALLRKRHEMMYH